MVSKAKTATKVNGLDDVQVDFVVFYVYVLAHCPESQSGLPVTLLNEPHMGQDFKALFLFFL